MVIPSVGDVVTIAFPFSDLSKAKLRPAFVLADVGKDDWILAQITSKSYADARAISLTNHDFAQGESLTWRVIFVLVSYLLPIA